MAHALVARDGGIDETGRATRESLHELIYDGYWQGTLIANLEAFVTGVLHNIDKNEPERAPHPERAQFASRRWMKQSLPEPHRLARARRSETRANPVMIPSP